jgi:predicted Zn finger-like uncharacterized protein
MLLTTCPNCSAQFKVQPEQLNVRQGRVMCGRCRGVFNAFQSLKRVEENEAAALPLAEPAASLAEPSPAIVTDQIFLRPEPPPLSAEFSQSDFAADIRAFSPSEPFSDSAGDAAPTLDGLRANSPLPFSSLLPTDAETAAPAGANPLLAPAAGHRPSADVHHSRLWSTGAVFLLLGLAGQITYGYRSAVIQSFPSLRPSFVSVCEWVGCALSWGRDDNAIRIEASDLIETPGKAGNILLTATLVNRAATRQDLPALELKLTDNANQVILSRVLSPHDYLGRTPAADESLAPNVETYVNLRVELANKTQASGYGVRAFYN